MLGQVSLFNRKALASAFLSVEPTTHGVPTHEERETLSPEIALEGIEAKATELEQWTANVGAVYTDAFNRSGRVVDANTELQRFTELKRVAQGAAGLNVFLNVLLEEQSEMGHHSPEAAQKLRSLKQQGQKKRQETAQLTTELAVQYDQLKSSLKDAQTALKGVIQTPSLDETLSQKAVRKAALKSAIEQEESISRSLLAELGSFNHEGGSLDEALHQEHTEMALLKEMIQRQTQMTLSKKERREISRKGTEALLQQMEQMGSFLVKLGGVEMEGTGLNPLILKLRTDLEAPSRDHRPPKMRSFVHRLKLELHPSTCDITGAQLLPDEGLDLDRVIHGQTLSQGVLHVRSLLFLKLHQRLHLEMLSEYRFSRVDAEHNIWRVALPNQIEIEMILPDIWPHEQTTELQLLTIQAPRVGVRFDVALKEIQQQTFTDLNCFLAHITQRTQSM